MGTNRRYGDAISRQKDNARAEAKALKPSSLPLELVTAAGSPITQAEHPTPVTAYVEVGVTLIRVAGHATAWNSRCVHVRWTGTNPEASEAWVWASAVIRDATQGFLGEPMAADPRNGCGISSARRRCGTAAAQHNPDMAGTLRALALSGASLGGAFLLGALLCVMKGEGGGLAMDVGNLSAPYVIVAVAAGLTAPRWWLGAGLGVIATELTVASFYGTWANYFGHEVSQYSLALWGDAGIASGALFGITGSTARTRRGLRYVLPALLLLEPVVTEGAAPVLARFGFGYGWGRWTCRN